MRYFHYLFIIQFGFAMILLLPLYVFENLSDEMVSFEAIGLFILIITLPTVLFILPNLNREYKNKKSNKEVMK